MAGSARTLRAVEDRPRTSSQVDRGRHPGTRSCRPQSSKTTPSVRSNGSSRSTRPSSGPTSTLLAPGKRGSTRGPFEAIAVNGECLGRSRGGLSTKLHLAVDGRGLPLSVILTPGQDGDNPQLLPLLDQIRVPRSGPGRPRSRPDAVLADKAYSHPSTRAALRARHIRFTSPQRSDQIAHRHAKGSRGGRPPAVDLDEYKVSDADGGSAGPPQPRDRPTQLPNDAHRTSFRDRPTGRREVEDGKERADPSISSRIGR